MQLNGERVSRETQDRLSHFEHLFVKWARSINLVAPSTKGQFWERHIADSAQIFQLRPEPLIWADLGSGGGFPGIITALFLAELKAGWVHLVESNQKKAAFLRQALRETGARGSVHPRRIEETYPDIGRVDAVSARAIADLDLLCEFVLPWQQMNSDLVCYFHKGRDYRSEIDKARGRWAFDLVQHQSKIETDSVILELRSLRSI